MAYPISILFVSLSVLLMGIGASVFTANRDVTPFMQNLGIFCIFGWWIPTVAAVFVLIRFAKWRLKLIPRIVLAVTACLAFHLFAFVFLLIFAHTSTGKDLLDFLERLMYA